MRCDRLGMVLSACLAWGALMLPAAPQSAAQPEPAKQAAKKLVRLDLLAVPRPAPQPAKRNIFINQGAAAEDSGIPLVRRGGNRPRPGLEAFEAEQAGRPAPVSTNSGPDLSLRYIGYIVSSKGTIGLVVLEGKAQAVAEGEPIREGFLVVRITREVLEVKGPAGEVKTFSLEGAQE